MKRVAIAFAFLIAFSLSFAAADKPDFSGMWVLDTAKSDFGVTSVPPIQTNVIEHKEPNIRMTTTSKGQQGEHTTERRYTTDGKENTNSIGPGVAKSTFKWDSANSVFDLPFARCAEVGEPGPTAPDRCAPALSEKASKGDSSGPPVRTILIHMPKPRGKRKAHYRKEQITETIQIPVLNSPVAVLYFSTFETICDMTLHALVDVHCDATKNALGVPEDVKRGVWKRDGYRCKECGIAVGGQRACLPRTHHMIPSNNGGSDELLSLRSLVTLIKRRIASCTRVLQTSNIRTSSVTSSLLPELPEIRNPKSNDAKGSQAPSFQGGDQWTEQCAC